MRISKKIRKLFPLDFYGENNSWQFIIRANTAKEVLDALMWRSFLSIRRKECNLLRIAVTTFPYESDFSKGVAADYQGNHGCMMKVKMLGPIVEVSALNRTYHEKKAPK